MKKLLFVCTRNRLRSPTAEMVFSGRADLEVASVGTNHDADVPLTADLVEWADLIFVMEKSQRTKVQTRFRAALKGKHVTCLDIPDNYGFMDPDLTRILETKMARHLSGTR